MIEGTVIEGSVIEGSVIEGSVIEGTVGPAALPQKRNEPRESGLLSRG